MKVWWLSPPFQSEKRNGSFNLENGREGFNVSGNSWDVSSVDIAAACLGWFAIELKRESVLGVWTYSGIDVVSCNSLVSKGALF